MKQLHKHLSAWLLILMCSLKPYGSASASTKDTKPNKVVEVVLTQFISHQALNAVRDGAVQSIKTCAKSDFDVKFHFSDASGNALVARQIAQKHASEKPDVIVAISTLSAQSVIGAVRGQVPIVFGAVTDPNAAQITGANITGVTDQAPFLEQIKFIHSLVPSVQTIAVLYNPGEDNSRAALNRLAPVFKALDLVLLPVVVTKVVEITQAVHKLKGQAQAIFIANDNLMASGFGSLVKAAKQHSIPVFASDVMLVHQGAIAMRGIDYYQSGRQVGQQVCSILKGSLPSDMLPESPQDLKLIINVKAAQDFGISIPKDMLSSADEVVACHMTQRAHQDK